MQEQEKKLNIRLAGFSFDPLTETPDIPEELRVEKVPEGPAPTIVQFKKSLTREERVHIQTRYGLKLTDYIPEYAYLEAVTTATLRKLSTDPLLRGSVPYHPAFKVAPSLGKIAFRTGKRKRMKGLWLHVVLFREADPESVAKALKKGESDPNSSEGRPPAGREYVGAMHRGQSRCCDRDSSAE